MAGLKTCLLLLLSVMPGPLYGADLFSWPTEASQLFPKITSLPRQDVVERIRAVVEPMTKEALTQLTPEVVRQFADMPKEDMVKYVVGVLEPATKSVVNGVSGIVKPATTTLRELIETTRTGIEGGVRDVLKPAAQGLGTVAAPALDEIIRLAVDGIRLIWRNTFEPLNVAHMDLNINDQLLKASLTLKEVQVFDASSFVMDEIHSEPLSMAANFTAHVDAFYVTGLYDMDAVFNGTSKIFGVGNFTVVIRGLRVKGRVELGFKNLFLHVNDLGLDIAIDSLQMKLKSSQGSDALAELLSGIISDVGPAFLEEFRPEVGAIMSSQIKNFINELLGSYNIPSILDRFRQNSELLASKRMASAAAATAGRLPLPLDHQLQKLREQQLLEQLLQQQLQQQREKGQESGPNDESQDKPKPEID